jgi:5'/3'-nucleotidase SurE
MNNNDPLHVLITNDDGHHAPGIRALQRVFTRAGHRVSMVAPRTEQSATGMGITSRRNLELFQFDTNSWHLDGQPADTILVALRHLLEDDPPDLVLSGINFGPNLGTAVYMSGTMGAAIMALLNGVPAIAVSAGMQFDEIATEFPSTFEVFEPAAEFTCSVVDALRSSVGKSGRLLPQDIFLNINYPALPRDRIKGVLHPDISAGKVIELAYRRCEQTGQVIPSFIAGVDLEQPHKETGDVRAHLEGYITISAVRPRWNPSSAQAKKMRKRLGSLEIGF